MTGQTRRPRRAGSRPATAQDVLPTLEAVTALGAAADDPLAEVIGYIQRYVVMTPAQLVAAAVWVIHTHAVKVAEQTPYLVITSPEKQCGKTRLMEVLNLLVARSWSAVNPSEAVIYRRVSATVPTLLLDEVDAIFNPRTADKHEGLRALINAGNRPGAKVPRCVGPTSKIVEFNVYCPKALAGIGTLPDTITDRALPIRLKRKRKDETVEDFHRRDAEPAAGLIKHQIAAWASEHADALRDARPQPPDGLSDRMQDACEALIAIADLVGGPWSRLVRLALIELCTGERADDTESMRLRLLRDVKEIYTEQGARQMSTARLLRLLIEREESPWASYYGGRLDPRDLSNLLKQYGVHSTSVRVGKGAKDVKRGYRRRDLAEAWQRYV